jgi:hypothetical protein
MVAKRRGGAMPDRAGETGSGNALATILHMKGSATWQVSMLFLGLQYTVPKND